MWVMVTIGSMGCTPVILNSSIPTSQKTLLSTTKRNRLKFFMGVIAMTGTRKYSAWLQRAVVKF
jgi:hypothetical protein